MKMRSALLELLQKGSKTEVNTGTKKHIFIAFFCEIPHTVTQRRYNAANCCSQIDTVPVMFSV